MALFYENIMTKEIVICRNPRDVKFIDGKQFILVENKQGRRFFANRDSFKRIKQGN